VKKVKNIFFKYYKKVFKKYIFTPTNHFASEMLIHQLGLCGLPSRLFCGVFESSTL